MSRCSSKLVPTAYIPSPFGLVSTDKTTVAIKSKAHESPETMKTMEPGMTFTIEPVICEGTEKYKVLPDKWTIVSKDNSRSSQFEHTVLITNSGVKIMSKWYFDEYGEI